jgi:peptidoglycan-associated lipoprotein
MTMINKNLSLLLIALTLSSCCQFKSAIGSFGGESKTNDVVAREIIIYSLPEAEIAKSETGAQVIFFDTNSAQLTKYAIVELDKKVLSEAKSPNTGKVVVEAHADERGSEAYNQKLSVTRARAVKSYLVKNGVKNVIIKTVGYGESKPAALGHDEESWSKNRRAVTISIKK